MRGSIWPGGGALARRREAAVVRREVPDEEERRAGVRRERPPRRTRPRRRGEGSRARRDPGGETRDPRDRCAGALAPGRRARRRAGVDVSRGDGAGAAAGGAAGRRRRRDRRRVRELPTTWARR
jgi:hypothetical protein